MTRRTFLASAGAALGAARLASGASGSTRMGIAWTSYMTLAKPRDTMQFLEHCHSLGAAGIQTALNGDPATLRARAEQWGMYLEAMVDLPKGNDTAEFEHSLAAASAAGAICLRAGALAGRRYETFASLDAWKAFTANTEKSIEAALPLLAKHKLRLALENHKDWTADELVALIKKYSSEYLGVCLDFGNNLALLENPLDVAEKLAPYTFATHLKDMAVEPYEDGFLLSEMPLGKGFLDLPRMISLVRKAHPETRFSLEMITRDPLRIPCFTDKYWTVFPDRGGIDLARTIRLIREKKSRVALPRIGDLNHDEQLDAEEQNVLLCMTYAREKQI